MRTLIACLILSLIASVSFATNEKLILPKGWVEDTLPAKTEEVFVKKLNAKKTKPWVIWKDGQPFLTKEGQRMKEFLELWYLLNKVSK